MPRVIALWLDGFDMALADAYELPALAGLQRRGLVATLDNGSAYLSGLTGEHLSTGLDPQAASRFSAVRFDPTTYHCFQEGSRYAPVFDGMRTVVFDMAYFDMDRASDDVVGITDWGVHDPGGGPQSRPASLRSEIEERFSAYPALPWIYGTPWASSRECKKMGEGLCLGADIRGRIATWLLEERFTDWDLAIVGLSEAHSASEGLFHGSGSAHPWASLPSASEAGVALRSVYSTLDQVVGRVVQAFPEDTVVVFSMHGMGPNRSDVPSMALLGELMARWSGLELAPELPFKRDLDGLPLLAPRQGWTNATLGSLSGIRPSRTEQLLRAVLRRLPIQLSMMLARVRRKLSKGPAVEGGSLAWMPVMRHQKNWPRMKAFAIPSFYDGRIRVNLQGRESSGSVTIDEYHSLLDAVEDLLRACTESRSGRPAVSEIQRAGGDPLTRSDDDVDLIVHWADDVLGITHPDLGEIGPLPPRRTGGHTSPMGRCIIVGDGVPPGNIGIRSSFDVIPTLFSLAGVTPPTTVSGRTLIDSIR